MNQVMCIFILMDLFRWLLFCGVPLTENHCVFSPFLSVVPYWLWFGEEVPRQPNTTAHPLQRRQEPDWHSTLCLHQCTPGHWTEVCHIHTHINTSTLEQCFLAINLIWDLTHFSWVQPTYSILLLIPLMHVPYNCGSI